MELDLLHGVAALGHRDPGTPQFNADARNLATSLAISVPIIPFFNVNNWSSVNDNSIGGTR